MKIPIPTVLYAIAFLAGALLVLASSWKLTLGVALMAGSYFELRKTSLLPTKDVLDWLRNFIDEQKQP